MGLLLLIILTLILLIWLFRPDEDFRDLDNHHSFKKYHIKDTNSDSDGNVEEKSEKL